MNRGLWRTNYNLHVLEYVAAKKSCKVLLGKCLGECLADVIECRLPPLTLTRGSEDPPPVIDSSGVAAVCCLLCFIHSYSYTANCFSNCSLATAWQSVGDSLSNLLCCSRHVLHCTALHCTYCTYCTVCSARYCTALYCTCKVLVHYYRPLL